MLKQKDEDDTKAGVHRNVDTNVLFQKAFYPLTLPLTVGPGSISVAITLGANEAHRQHSLIFSMLGAVIVAVLIQCSLYLCYAFSDRLAQGFRTDSMGLIKRPYSFSLVLIGNAI